MYYSTEWHNSLNRRYTGGLSIHVLKLETPACWKRQGTKPRQASAVIFYCCVEWAAIVTQYISLPQSGVLQMCWDCNWQCWVVQFQHEKGFHWCSFGKKKTKHLSLNQEWMILVMAIVRGLVIPKLHLQCIPWFLTLQTFLSWRNECLIAKTRLRKRSQSFFFANNLTQEGGNPQKSGWPEVSWSNGK